MVFLWDLPHGAEYADALMNNFGYLSAGLGVLWAVIFGAPLAVVGSALSSGAFY
ncbi:hypothetical protein [Corynebacterium glutamicum]|uniref:hypothetical protein n=1 Tax=Corynebacterium glutamicum TaxID=1718 RepID=UPI001B8B51C2|nr:hypothetical protein [Corynebacterium glutamicum]